MLSLQHKELTYFHFIFSDVPKLMPSCSNDSPVLYFFSYLFSFFFTVILTGCFIACEANYFLAHSYFFHSKCLTRFGRKILAITTQYSFFRLQSITKLLLCVSPLISSIHNNNNNKLSILLHGYVKIEDVTLLILYNE